MGTKYTGTKKTIAFRLEDAQIARLQRVAEATGLEPSEIIRNAIDGLIRHFDLCGGRLVFPINFGEMIQVIQAMPSLRVAEDPPDPKTAQGQGGRK